MVGSRKWFRYEDDLGTEYAINLDESNTEAVNAGDNDLSTSDLPAAVPRNIKVREVFYTNARRTRTIRCVCLTPTIYQGVVQGGVPTIPDPIGGAGGGQTDLGLIRANGERRSLPIPLDSGLTDGDED